MNDSVLVHVLNPLQNLSHYNFSLYLRNWAFLHYDIQDTFSHNPFHYEIASASQEFWDIIKPLYDIRMAFLFYPHISSPHFILKFFNVKLSSLILCYAYPFLSSPGINFFILNLSLAISSLLILMLTSLS